MRMGWMGVLCAAATMLATGWACGGEAGNHYVNGVEGIKGASVPPAGLYYRLYTVYYTADRLNDADGDKLPIGFDVSVFALVNRVIWVSKCKWLGADVGMDALVPLVNTDLSVDAMNLDESAFGVGDIYFEPLLMAWHMPRCDAAIGLSAFAPTAEADEPADPGKNYWTGMLTVGSTVYGDAARTLSLSLLGRYETHSDDADDDIRLGDDFHVEWGLGKTLAKVWDVGIAGYSQWQVTGDRGDDVTWKKSDYDEVHAAGPEISVFSPKAMAFFSLRGLWEFGAKDRTEGQVATLTFTKIL